MASDCQSSGPGRRSSLPHDFLSQPVDGIRCTRINWEETPLPKYKGLYAVVIDNALTAEECRTLVSLAEATTGGCWKRAMVNIGGGKQRLMTDARNCGRIIWDDRDLAGRIWNRIQSVPELQEILRLEDRPRMVGNGPAKRNEVWRFSRPNERLRFLKYVGGEYFRPHADGVYETPDFKERSYATLHLYLSGQKSKEELQAMSAEERKEAEEDQLLGGATTFHDLRMEQSYDVFPRPGRILIFQHRDLIHSGEDVERGVKYTMRTDLMYSKA